MNTVWPGNSHVVVNMVFATSTGAGPDIAQPNGGGPGAAANDSADGSRLHERPFFRVPGRVVVIPMVCMV